MKHPSGIEPMSKVVHREVVIPEESTRQAEVFVNGVKGRRVDVGIYAFPPICINLPFTARLIDPWALGWQAWAKSKPKR